MGDRVYATIEFGGHIETVAEIEAMCQALASERIESTIEGEPVSGLEKAMAHLRDFVEQGIAPSFYGHEVNYGRFEGLEALVDEIPGLGCLTCYSEGGDFHAGSKTILPGGSVHEGYGPDGFHVSLHELKKAREAADPLAAFDAIINAADLAAGNTLPPFTVSPAVAAWLKIFAQPMAA